MSTLKTNAITTVAGKPILNSTGSVLQVAYTESIGQVTSSAGSYTILQPLVLTATASNSRYILIGYAHAYSATAGTRSNLGFSVTNNSITTRIFGVDGASGDSWGTTTQSGCQLNRSGVYTSSASAGTLLIFNLLGTSYENTTIFNLAGYGHKLTFTVLEISS
jgi:hypothetical protein